MSFDIRYGRPKAARRKTRKGFFEGAGGWFEGDDAGERPRNAAKADGVREVASAGGGRPIIFAKSVRT